MTKRKLFRGRYETLMGYEPTQSQQDVESGNTSRKTGSKNHLFFSSPADAYTQERTSFMSKPCETPHSLEGQEMSPILTHLSPVQKFYAKYPNWEEQAREMIE